MTLASDRTMNLQTLSYDVIRGIIRVGQESVVTMRMVK